MGCQSSIVAQEKKRNIKAHLVDDEITNAPILQSLPSSTEPQKDQSFIQNLKNLLIQIKMNSSQADLIGPDVWKHIFSKFQNFYFRHDDKVQFLNVIERYFEVNSQGLEQSELANYQHGQFDFCGQIGQKLHKIQRIVEPANETLHKIISLLIEQKLLNQSSDDIASKVSELFERNPDSFALLSLSMLMDVKKKLQLPNNDIKKVNKEFEENVKQLETKYPPSKQSFYDQNLKKYCDEFKKDDYRKEKIIFTGQTSKMEQMKDFIIQKVKNAESDYEIFNFLVKNTCYKHGYGLKTGLKIKKIKGQYNVSALQRTIEKMTENLRKNNKKLFEQNTQKIMEKYSNQQISSEGLLEFIQTEIKQVETISQQILNKQDSIEFDVKDLLRGKCVFEKIEDLTETAKELQKKIREEGHKIIDLKNRFNNENKAKATNDLVFIIQLPNSMAELQLVMKLDSNANEFNHKLYELERSSTYSLITNLYILNERFCQKLFGQLTDFKETINTIDVKIKNGSTQGLNQKNIKFNEFIEDLLKNKLLKTIKRQQEKKEENQNINRMFGHIKQKCEGQCISKQNQRKREKERNEINLLYEIIDYQKVIELFKSCKKSQGLEYSFILNTVGSVYDNQGNYAEALKNYNKCLQIETKIKGSQSIDVASTLNSIGSVYDNQGNYAEALKNYNKCLEIKTKIKGSQSIDVASTLNNIGLVYSNQGNYAEALKNYNKCLEIQTKIKGSQSIDVAVTLNNIGSVNDNQGNYAEALKNYNKCLEIETKIKGSQSIGVAGTLNNIGLVYYNQGNNAEALKNYNKSLEIRTKIKGSQSIDVAQTLNNIGLVYYNKGNNAEALKNYNKCLQIETKIKGSQSIDVASTLNSIGSVYDNQGNYAEALKNYNKCLEIKTKIKGSQSIDVASTLNNIGLVYSNQGNYAEALKNYNKCLEIQTKIKGSQSIDVAGTLNGIGLVYDYQGNYAEALKNYNKCLEIQTKIKGSQSIDVASTLNNIGFVYKSQGNYDEALKNYNKCLEIETKIKGSQSIDVAGTLYNLCFVYENLGDKNNALECCKKSYEIYFKILGSQHPSSMAALSKLTSFQ